MAARPATDAELAVLRRLLEPPFPGRDEHRMPVPDELDVWAPEG